MLKIGVRAAFQPAGHFIIQQRTGQNDELFSGQAVSVEAEEPEKMAEGSMNRRSRRRIR